MARFTAVLLLVCVGVAVSVSAQCSSGQTKCSNGQGGFGCCPVANATCCSDHIHCCPPAYPVCDTAKGECLSSFAEDALRVPALKKEQQQQPEEPKKPVKPEPTVSCGGGYQCSTGQTCCSNGQGGYGCCPIANATCCSDHIHCCPSAYPVCDTAKGECLSSFAEDALRVPALKKKEPLVEPKKPVKPEPTVSCGGGYQCSTGQTCCSNGQGGYGCCPIANATCCSDHIHCCPSAYPVCDTAKGECLSKAADGMSLTSISSVPILKKEEAFFLN